MTLETLRQNAAPIRCAWCNGEIERPEDYFHPERRIVPALCTSCREHFVFQMGVPLQTFLNRLPAPVFVVGKDAVVQGANTLAYTLLRRTPETTEGKLSGVVFECAYARLPKGCGRTVHCSGCTIRRTVYHTAETGESLNAVPATLHWGDAGDPRHVAMLISTEKMGDVVLLRIDRIAADAAGAGSPTEEQHQSAG